MHIHLRVAAGRVASVQVASRRAVHACRVFAGKPPEQVLRVLPVLYAVCGNAQAAASLAAMESALGREAHPRLAAARALVVWAETAREHLWRLFLDWPRRLGEAPDTGRAGVVNRLLPQFREAAGSPLRLAPAPLAVDSARMAQLTGELAGLLANGVFGMDPGEWRPRDGAELTAWARQGGSVAARLLDRVLERGWAGLGACPVPPLPVLDEAELARRLAGPGADAFVQRPDWHGQIHETTPLGRQAAHPLVRRLAAEHGSGLITRLAARLVELAGLPDRLARLAQASAGGAPGGDASLHDRTAGEGIGQVQAARGLLVHRVALESGRVADYRILAPTEWNFHPRGALARGLTGMSARDEADLHERVGLLVEAMDPCVGHGVTVEG